MGKGSQEVGPKACLGGQSLGSRDETPRPPICCLCLFPRISPLTRTPVYACLFTINKEDHTLGNIIKS